MAICRNSYWNFFRRVSFRSTKGEDRGIGGQVRDWVHRTVTSGIDHRSSLDACQDNGCRHPNDPAIKAGDDDNASGSLPLGDFGVAAGLV